MTTVALNITYSECVPVVLIIQQAKHTECIILSSVVCLALPYFSTLSHKWHNFWKNLLNKKWVLIFSVTSVWNISHSKKCVNEMLLKMYICKHVKYLLFFSDFNETWIFWEIFEKYLSNLMKIHAVRAELFNEAVRIDRQPWWSQELLFAILQTYLKA